MNASALILSPAVDEVSIIIPDAIQLERKAALEACQDIVQVTNPTELADAITAAGMCKSLEKSCESAREAIKKPVLDAGRRIDTVAKGFASGLAVERARIERLAADYHALVSKRAAEMAAQEIAEMPAPANADEMRDQHERRMELTQPIKAQDATFRTYQDYRELNLLELAKVRPDLVKMEVRRKELLCYLSIPGHAPLPGIEEYTEHVMHAKAV